MQRNDILIAFTGILEEVAGVNRTEVARDKRFREDLGIGSLSLIDVAIAAEGAFGIRIPDEDLEHFETVGDAVDYIQYTRVAASGAALDRGAAGQHFAKPGAPLPQQPYGGWDGR